MASAALNSGLLEALVSRGGAAVSQASEDQSPASHDPSAAHHAYLHAHFQDLASHYGGGTDLHDMPTSVGDVTTEEEDVSLSEHFSHYYRHGTIETIADDLLSATAKKRRKQSKPSRLSTPKGQPGDSFQLKAEESQFDSEASNPSADGDEAYSCPHCHMNAASDDALRRHIIEEHIGRLLSDDEVRQQQQQQQQREQQQQQQQQRDRLKGEDGSGALNLSSPRWEERPASRPKEEEARSPPTSIPMPPSFGDMKFSLPGLLPLGPPPFLLPFLQQAEHERLSAGLHTGSPSSSSAHGRSIFNQEAYCDLCNKEFCNKYFLKTHKANKHGIYSPEISSSPTGLHASISTPLGPSLPLASPLGPGGFVGSPYAGAFIAANMTNIPLRPPLLSQVSSAKAVPLDKAEFDNGGGVSNSGMGGVGGSGGGGNGGSSSSSNSGGGGGGAGSTSSGVAKAAGIINLEAYCELCQKEFCNKYFLKRHKSKIHGVMIDVVTKAKTPGQMVAPDRPEGWCDACRRDIGGRAALSAHKLQVHGPHIVAPMPSPQSSSPQTTRNPRTPTPKDGRKDGPEHKELRDYFSPWEVFRDSREAGREMWDSVKDANESTRDPARSTPVRSPWDRPLGSPWDAVKVPEALKESSKEAILRGDHWSEPSNTDLHGLREDRATLAHISRLTNSHDFSLDARETQSMREQQQREWEAQQQRDMEHQHRERVRQQQKQHMQQEQLPERQEIHYREQQQDREFERELQERKRNSWSQEREQKLYSDNQMELDQLEQQEQEGGSEQQQQQHNIKRETETLIKSENSFHDGEEEGVLHCHQSEQSDEQRSEAGRMEVRQFQEDIAPQTAEDNKMRSPNDDEGLKNNSRYHERSRSGYEEGAECSEKEPEKKNPTSGVREARDDTRDAEHEEREAKSGAREGCPEGRETFREGHRTPGSSSADESSRETGIIARVGQPAMVQAPPGTKFTPEQLRQLGVINPDAFCELCCKEFCNKYFLRTHRIKKHGIYTPEFSERSKPQPKENSSLNLTRLLERQTLDVRPPMHDLESDLECELCRRPFPSTYLLQMHKYYFHGPGHEAILPHEPTLALHPHPLPHEQLRQLALHAQQQQQQAQSQQTHQKRIHEQQRHLQEQQRRLQEHQHRLQKHHQQQREAQREAANQKERPQVEEGGTAKAEEPQRPSVIESAGSGESDASEDLRKLQSMILQLNRQDEVSVRCRVCSKELGNKYFLRAHMMTEHGVLGHDEISGPPSEGAQTPKTPREATPKMSPPSTPLSAENQAFCSICKKDFFSRYILQQHLLSAHGVFTPPAPPTSFMERIKAEVEGRDTERKPQSTSRSYCEICNKELCNKYFMKTHMLKMHGINVENGVMGGVTCDLCNKELCSKYFLRVHKLNTHGMVEEGREGDEGINKFEIELCPLCPRRFKNRKWLKTHLTSDHDEAGKEKWREIEASWKEIPPQAQGPTCVLCGHVLPDMVALQLHIIKVHSPQDAANDQDSRTSTDEAKDDTFKCSLCPFTAPNPALLFAHSRTHVPGVSTFSGVLSQQTLPCSLCPQVFTGLETYQNHLLQHHLQGLFKPLLEGETNENNQEEPIAPPSPEAPAESTPETSSQTLRRRKRWRCSQCGRRFKSRALCLAHVHALHNPRARGTWLGRPAIHRRLYKCRKCGAMAPRLTELRQHIREQHQSREGVPTSHATPTKPTSAGRFVMQPFLMNDSRGEEDGKEQEGRCNERQFVPSLVYLPVARRVHHPLTVSFSLTPA